jgi:adenosylcobyric acid synthase
MQGIDHRSHGACRRELAIAAGVPEEAFLDFSANINPLGPPSWLAEAIAEGTRRVAWYPDPDSRAAREAAARRYGIASECFLFADGADSLILALPRALGAVSCIVVSPTYSSYLRAATLERAELLRVPLFGEGGPSLASVSFIARLSAAIETAPRPALVFLGAPNNPVGGSVPREILLELASRHPEATFALDESFAELAGEDQGMIGWGGPNLVVLRSLTKTWAAPGARVGFASAAPSILDALRAELSAWPLSSFGEAIAVRALGDLSFAAASAAFVARAEADFARSLDALGGIKVHRSGANFLLLEFCSPDACRAAHAALLRCGMAARLFSEAEGLDGRFMRAAVRRPEENARFLAALAGTRLGSAPSPGGDGGPAGRPRA